MRRPSVGDAGLVWSTRREIGRGGSNNGHCLIRGRLIARGKGLRNGVVVGELCTSGGDKVWVAGGEEKVNKRWAPVFRVLCR
jgi:hypothetical protein